MYFNVLFRLVTYNLIEGDYMASGKIEEFKIFIKANPFLIKYIRDGKKTWQDLYEMYDMYEDDTEAWNKFLEESKDNTNSKSSGLKLDDIVNMVKNVDVDKVQEGITSLQKTLSLFGDLFVNNNSNTGNTYNPRHLYRRFDD